MEAVGICLHERAEWQIVLMNCGFCEISRNEGSDMDLERHSEAKRGKP